ncbi:hypothetical protein ACC736_37330, partial [Rhizobium ruizarguesonis]
AELMAQLAANAAEIAALKAEKEALSARVIKLEEELALAQLHRFAPRSEKHVDRLCNAGFAGSDHQILESEPFRQVNRRRRELSACDLVLPHRVAHHG